MCVCEGGGGIVFDLDSVRCEPRTHGIESHHLTEPDPYSCISKLKFYFVSVHSSSVFTSTTILGRLLIIMSISTILFSWFSIITD